MELGQAGETERELMALRAPAAQKEGGNAVLPPKRVDPQICCTITKCEESSECPFWVGGCTPVHPPTQQFVWHKIAAEQCTPCRKNPVRQLQHIASILTVTVHLQASLSLQTGIDKRSSTIFFSGGGQVTDT
jgi:hypothetical protein